MKKDLFIKTSDPHTKEMLLEAGLEIIEESNGITTFRNEPVKKVDFEDAKVVFTSHLNM